MNENKRTKVDMLSISKLIIVAATSLVFIYSVAAEDQNKGEENITLFGGSTGPVPFPHGIHQNKLGGCNTCHDLFPQHAGAIEKLKAQGTLKKQEVMLCL